VKDGGRSQFCFSNSGVHTTFDLTVKTTKDTCVGSWDAGSFCCRDICLPLPGGSICVPVGT
jgi:hypothetical protein